MLLSVARGSRSNASEFAEVHSAVSSLVFCRVVLAFILFVCFFSFTLLAVREEKKRLLKMIGKLIGLIVMRNVTVIHIFSLLLTVGLLVSVLRWLTRYKSTTILFFYLVSTCVCEFASIPEPVFAD